jgi:hypothetical protein
VGVQIVFCHERNTFPLTGKVGFISFDVAKCFDLEGPSSGKWYKILKINYLQLYL